MILDDQFERLDEFEEEVIVAKKEKNKSLQGGARRRSVLSKGPSQSTLQFLQKEDEKFKKGVDTAKDILKDVKLMNMKLDDISGLVKLQRQKLLNMQDKIKTSQNYMARSKKLLQTFSKEIYGDKIIMCFGLLIGIVLLFIGILFTHYIYLCIYLSYGECILIEFLIVKISKLVFWNNYLNWLHWLK